VNTNYKIEVKYDMYPKEFSWWIKDVKAGKIVMSARANSVTEAETTLTKWLQLTPGSTYRLNMRDRYGDGLTDGYVKIFKVSGSQHTLIKSFAGSEIGSSKAFKFTG
jgi:hypothetical protein